LQIYLNRKLLGHYKVTHQWLQSHNEERPHDALGSLPPAVFGERLLTGKNSTSELSTDGGAYG
jgi:hypothetical protein